jgi:hypothetical protein
MMHKRTAWTGLLLLIVAGLSHGGSGSGSQAPVWEKIRSQLPAGSDIRVRVLHDEVVEVQRPDGLRLVVDLADFGARTRQMAAIGDTARRTIRFDLTQLDTSGFSGRFRLVTQVPVWTALVADSDQDGLPELPGVFRDFDTDARWLPSRIYEKVSPNENGFEVAFEDTNLGTPRLTGDINGNGLPEIVWRRLRYDSLGGAAGVVLDVYESPQPGELATHFLFSHVVFERGAVVMFPRITDLDRDGKLEVLYLGDDFLTAEDPAETTFLAEYDDTSQSLRRVFRVNDPRYGPANDWAVGDFDQDGRMEFATGGFDSQVFVTEHTGLDNDYAVAFVSDVAISNAGFHTEGNDIDGDGRPEFFIGGRGYRDGVWTEVLTCFETTGDNQYEKTVEIEIRGMGAFFTVPVLDKADITGDGVEEVLFSDGGTLVILRTVGDDDYEILWTKTYPIPIGGLSLSTGFISDPNRKDLLISREQWNETKTRIRHLTDVFTYQETTSVPEIHPLGVRVLSFLGNFPNPFNSLTVIRWQQAQTEDVTMQIVNLRGREVKRLLDHQTMGPGVHEAIWDGKNSEGGDAPTGVYFVRLRVGEEVATRKMLLVR